MKIVVHPGNPLRGEIALPGDKSISHRAALFAALACGESRIRNFLVAGVTQAMLSALASLGVAWELHGSDLLVQGRGLEGLRPPPTTLDCGNSGTTMRMLVGALAAAGIPAVLDGSAGLRRRPMDRVVEPLRRMGVPIQATPAGTAPLTLEARPPGQPLHGLDYTLPVASAQVKTALLLAALAGSGPTTLREPALSRDHSERMLASMGVSLRRIQSGGQPSVTLIPGHSSHLSPLDLTIPGDISSAAFLLVAALVTPGSQVTLRQVGLNPTRTGLLDALSGMGARLQTTNLAETGGEPVGDLTVGYQSINGINVSGPLVVRMIDEFPVFAVAAAFSKGRTVVRQASELRLKESDRIALLCRELRVLGAWIEETPDGFILQGGEKLTGGVAQAHGDHRLGMALAVAGLTAKTPVVVEGAEVIPESFPGFVEALRGLGADVQEWER